MSIEYKRSNLKSRLKELGSVMIAFSGGVDSTLLLYFARQVLGRQVAAASFDAGIISRRDIEIAREITRAYNIKHFLIKDDILLDRNEFTANQPERCYICKKVMMGKVKSKAGENNLAVIDGANADDAQDFRPGMQAAREMGIISPLQEAGLKKNEIRFLAKEEGVPVWDKPSSPCLCSRIPYGNIITLGKLKQIEDGEALLHEMGFNEVRLRHHNELARIEVPLNCIGQLLSKNVLTEVKNGLKNLGFTYITLDLEGFRSGSLNEVL
ncbi:MAG: ATP-dependent sacrificial sulfur transferase LarE [Clostridiales bacterium]|nr:ATP-dependent sacrificial sulfur transferase LarE [Clostridiales bacterium]MCF8022289.1 ATP-dependent sacrificial sulfur transferase LarE [Clostridiales bacterium]